MGVISTVYSIVLIHTYVAESTLFSLRYGHLSICQCFIAANAEVNSKDSDGETPLHYASR